MPFEYDKLLQFFNWGAMTLRNAQFTDEEPQAMEKTLKALGTVCELHNLCKLHGI